LPATEKGEKMTSQKRIDFIDLKAQQQAILPLLMERIQRVLSHGQYIMGPEVRELEEQLAAYVGVRQVISALPAPMPCSCP
jgi:dTDP-4-amino-4,6-dideoxygalactose transaminase